MENKNMSDHQILALILLIHAGMFVAALRILQLVAREVGENSAMTKATLDAVSKLLQQKS
jgi:hypothetical protein